MKISGVIQKLTSEKNTFKFFEHAIALSEKQRVQLLMIFSSEERKRTITDLYHIYLKYFYRR